MLLCTYIHLFLEIEGKQRAPRSSMPQQAGREAARKQITAIFRFSFSDYVNWQAMFKVRVLNSPNKLLHFHSAPPRLPAFEIIMHAKNTTCVTF